MCFQELPLSAWALPALTRLVGLGKQLAGFVDPASESMAAGVSLLTAVLDLGGHEDQRMRVALGYP